MQKRLIPLLLALSLLGGCAGNAGAQFVENALKLPEGVLTTSVQNPITKATLFRVENGMRVAVAGLNTYKTLCENETLAVDCVDVVATLQGYSKKARPLVRQLRSFVRKNDQINAKVVFVQIRALIAEFRITATAAGIPIPAALEVQ